MGMSISRLENPPRGSLAKLPPNEGSVPKDGPVASGLGLLGRMGVLMELNQSGESHNVQGEITLGSINCGGKSESAWRTG